MKTFKEFSLTEGKFTSAQLAKLKSKYAEIDKVNPSSPSFKKMKALMAKMSPEMLQQIVDAKVKFLQHVAHDLLKK
jgi:hypothetical protein